MKPKKSLGQNFLKDKVILDKIISAANLSADDFVIEVGPGEGALTEELAKHAKKIIAIEIDKNLAQRLDSRFHGNDKVEIITDDILKINLPELLIRFESANALNESTKFTNQNFSFVDSHPIRSFASVKYKVIANIPYYITSPIIRLFLETKFPPSEMILMVQKEVAERIVEKPGNMSILALSVQYYAEAELLFNVSKESFWPVPEVDSAVIKISNLKSHSPAGRAGISKIKTKKFFRIVKAGFSAKRKMLANNLSASLKIDKKEIEEKLKKAGLSPTARAQELSIDDWKKISNLLL